MLPCLAVNGTNFVVTLNPVVGRCGKDASPNLAKYNQYPSLFKAAVLKQNLDTPPVSKVTTAGDWQKLTIEETQGWTIEQFVVVEGQELLIVGHFEPTFAPNYCSPELRLDHVYILPIAEPTGRLRVARVRHVRVHVGNNNAEQHTQQEAQDRDTHGLLAARWSFRSCLALCLWRSRLG
jgi:hypothetical protein